MDLVFASLLLSSRSSGVNLIRHMGLGLGLILTISNLLLSGTINHTYHQRTVSHTYHHVRLVIRIINVRF